MPISDVVDNRTVYATLEIVGDMVVRMPENEEDPGASTQQFRAYAERVAAEGDGGPNKVVLYSAAAGLFVVAVVVIAALMT